MGPIRSVYPTRTRYSNKFDVITQKQANNICLAELDVSNQRIGKGAPKAGAEDRPKGLNNMGNT
jgi:hypothetical protein